jgi:cbb3-type cytochrome oxidase cytochrome c subunit
VSQRKKRKPASVTPQSHLLTPRNIVAHMLSPTTQHIIKKQNKTKQTNKQTNKNTSSICSMERHTERKHF